MAAAGEVESFVEKPSGDRLEVLAHASKHATAEFPFEASMGIYVFKRAPLLSLQPRHAVCLECAPDPDRLCMSSVAGVERCMRACSVSVRWGATSLCRKPWRW